MSNSEDSTGCACFLWLIWRYFDGDGYGCLLFIIGAVVVGAVVVDMAGCVLRL